MDINRVVIASEALHRIVFRAKRGNLTGLLRYFVPRNDNLSMAFTIITHDSLLFVIVVRIQPRFPGASDTRGLCTFPEKMQEHNGVTCRR